MIFENVKSHIEQEKYNRVELYFKFNNESKEIIFGHPNNVDETEETISFESSEEKIIVDKKQLIFIKLCK